LALGFVADILIYSGSKYKPINLFLHVLFLLDNVQISLLQLIITLF
jgi:hypothetical protein